MNLFDEKLRNCLDDEIIEPETLQTVEERAMVRYRGEKRKKAAQLLLMLTLIFSSFLFYTANTEAAFAGKLRGVPVLKDFLYAMDMSPKEKERLEELGILSESGLYDVQLQYALSEDKRLFLYFQFPEELLLEENERLAIELVEVYDLETEKDYLMTFQKHFETDLHLEHGYVMIQGFIPPGMDLAFPDKLHFAFKATVATNVWYEGGWKRTVEKEKPIGEYRFNVELQKMEKRIIRQLGKKVKIEGNSLNIDQLERGLRTLDIAVSESKHNPDIITEVSGYMRDRKTKEIIEESIIVSYSTKTKDISAIYVAEENIPDHGEVELVITEAMLLPKDQEYVTINMEEKKMTPEIPGISLTMVSSGKLTAVVFITEESIYPFDAYVSPESKEETRTPSPGIQNLGQNQSKFSYVFDEPLTGEIVFRRTRYSARKVVFETPIVIPLNVPDAQVITPVP